MTTVFLTAIGDGIHALNRNWQLVLVQMMFTMFSFTSFFIIVGVPIAVAFIIFGLDLTEVLRHDVLSTLRQSGDLIHKYFGMAVLIIVSVVVYLFFVIVVWVFTIGGTVGTLVRSIREGEARFSTRAFMTEGRRLFFPLLFFTTVVGILFGALALVLGVIGGGAAAIIDMAKEFEATLALFLGIFFSLVLLSCGLFLILAMLSALVYGIAHLAFEGSRPLAALKGSLNYLSAKPASIALYGFLIFCYILIGLVIVLIGSPLALVPVIGSSLSLPYQVFVYIVQCYVSLAMFAASFAYYFKTAYAAPAPATTAGPDTAPQQLEEPSPIPEVKEEPPQE